MREEPISIVQGESSIWDPSFRTLTITRDPLEASHEISHIKLGHTSSAGSKLSDLLEEREAWKEALRRISPEEIRVSKIRRDMSTYLDEVGREYGYFSPQYRIGSKWLEEVESLAEKRKKEVR